MKPEKKGKATIPQLEKATVKNKTEIPGRLAGDESTCGGYFLLVVEEADGKIGEDELVKFNLDIDSVRGLLLVSFGVLS